MSTAYTPSPQEQTLLAKLDDIILPAAPSGLAWGWIALAFIALVAVVAITIWLVLRHRAARPKREAIVLLHAQQDVFAQHTSHAQLCANVNTILKRFCRQRFEHALALSGEAWVDELNRLSKEPSPVFTGELARSLANGAYQSTHHRHASAEALIDASIRWLRSV